MCCMCLTRLRPLLLFKIHDFQSRDVFVLKLKTDENLGSLVVLSVQQSPCSKWIAQNYITRNSYLFSFPEYSFLIIIQASENKATVNLPALLCTLCPKHVVASREAHWFYFNVLSEVMLALEGKWHWSISLRNKTQMFPQGGGQIRTREFQHKVTEGVEDCCCQWASQQTQSPAAACSPSICCSWYIDLIWDDGPLDTDTEKDLHPSCIIAK